MRGKGTIVAALAMMLLRVPMAAAQGGCTGDCNADGRVTVGELITGVNISLGRAALDACAAFDANADGRVSIGELIGGVSSSLNGCVTGPGFAAVQAIFTANCTDVGCHSGNFPANNMSLVEGLAYDSIVGVTPFNTFAADDGYLRVDPSNPDNSYLLLKVETVPPPLLGSQMPQFADPLSDEDVKTIRDWIAAGAEP